MHFFQLTTFGVSLLVFLRDSSYFPKPSQFLTLTTLLGSLLNENSIGGSSNFLEVLHLFTFTAFLKIVLLHAVLICASIIFQGIKLIHTRFTLILMFSLIPSSSSSMSMASTFSRWYSIYSGYSEYRAVLEPCTYKLKVVFQLNSELKICSNFPS